MKLADGALDAGAVQGIAPRQRGAWIETEVPERISLNRLASPPGNGGRGLKRGGSFEMTADPAGIAPRQRGAWIETLKRLRGLRGDSCIAPRQRGAWIETAIPSSARPGAPPCIAPRQRGAWIETP